MEKGGYHMFSKPALVETGADLMVTMVPFWTAVAIGLVVGWSWKPRWVSFMVLGMRARQRLVWSTPPGFGARRIWLALTAITCFPVLKEAWSKFRAWMWPETISQSESLSCEDTSAVAVDGGSNDWALTTDDLVDFQKRLECQDGGAPWNNLMERSTDGMVYQAWRREPVDGAGPTEYRSRTVTENVTPEEMRDFFWDDEFRKEWDDMLISTKTCEVCPRTGAMIVHWVRKFPVFCKDRDYTISRRIWSAGNTYYCITKGVQYLKVPRQNAPRRVDVYFSSWFVRQVESCKGNGKFTSCEVMFFHHEDMGIQRDLAKLGIRQGMWGCVKKMGPGIKLYKAQRKEGKPQSQTALMASITTKVPPNFAQTLALPQSGESDVKDVAQVPEKPLKGGYMRWLVIGGAVALACGVDKGAVGKILVFGLARRFGNMSEKRRARY